MSRFDSYYESRYVERLRIFLRRPKKDFLYSAGLVSQRRTTGGVPAYSRAAVAALEAEANLKAARCEADDTTFGERLALARDYAFDTGAGIARQLGVSRELVRRWHAGLNCPSDAAVVRLGEVLMVPPTWLRHGGEEHLPAKSHLGLRFGEEARLARELLRTATIVEVSSDNVARTIDTLVVSHRSLSRMARRAGGRWHFNREWVYAPWEPIAEPRPTRKCWPDETEVIIAEELEANPSVYAAHRRIGQRCSALGLPYPAEISLYKRVQKAKLRRQRWGVSIEARNPF